MYIWSNSVFEYLRLAVSVYSYIYIYTSMFVCMCICPLMMVISGKWKGGCYQKSCWSLRLVETSGDSLALVRLGSLTSFTILMLVNPSSWLFQTWPISPLALFSIALHSWLFHFCPPCLLPLVPPPHPPYPQFWAPHTTGVWFFTSPLWLFFAKPGSFWTWLLCPSPGSLRCMYACLVSLLLRFLSLLQRGHAICLAFAHLQCVSSISHTISTTPMPLTEHMVGPVTRSWRMSRTVGLSGSEFTFCVGGLAEIQALLMTLSSHSLLSMTWAWGGWHCLPQRIGLNMYMENGIPDA